MALLPRCHAKIFHESGSQGKRRVERRGEAIDRVRIDRFNLSCLRGANGFTWKREFGPFDALVKTLFPTWWACWLNLAVGTLAGNEYFHLFEISFLFPTVWWFFFHGKIDELIRSVSTININWSNIYWSIYWESFLFERTYLNRGIESSTNRFFSKTLNIGLYFLTSQWFRSLIELHYPNNEQRSCTVIGSSLSKRISLNLLILPYPISFAVKTT